MCTFGPGTEVVDVKLVIVSREWTQATPWVFLGFAHTRYSRELE